MNYFAPTPTTCEELKKMYRALAHEYHPDCGGCTQAMQAINAEYTALFAELKNVHVNAEGEAYHKHTDEVPEEFIEIINRLIRMENIVIEVIGTFLWVSGDTKPYKDDLKSMRFKWHTKKICWYLAPEDYRKHNRKEYSMDELREMYNSQTVGTAPYKRVTMAVANA